VIGFHKSGIVIKFNLYALIEGKYGVKTFLSVISLVQRKQTYFVP